MYEIYKKYSLNKKYLSQPVTYHCTPIDSDVTLIPVFYLGTFQGDEGGLSPCSSSTYCSSADVCSFLKEENCPLKKGYGDELNKLKIQVLQNEPDLCIHPTNWHEIIAIGNPKLKGQEIWFGKSEILTVVPHEDELIIAGKSRDPSKKDNNQVELPTNKNESKRMNTKVILLLILCGIIIFVAMYEFY